MIFNSFDFDIYLLSDSVESTDLEDLEDLMDCLDLDLIDCLDLALDASRFDLAESLPLPPNPQPIS